MNKEKIIRDPIYGYIPIPDVYCKNFIDTKIFQRLRRIEQTSMRVLYPSAHHDRFAHSIGTYYLGSIAFRSIEQNSKEFFSSTIIEEKREYYKNTFELACLLHDCGHSPFSHTFEHYYLYHREDKIKNRLSKFFEDKDSFSEEYDNASPAPHEKISALLVLENFYDQIKNCNASPQLVARMIMGMKHENNLNPQKKFENKLILLLNGSGVDVDTLDYIQRDSWASGVSNVKIDYHRFLSSIMIKSDKYENVHIVFKKKALSILDNINIGRNFLYKWIYSHHKVIYEQELLRKIIEKINKDSNEELSKTLFSIEALTEPQTFNGITYFLPTDDDVIYTIKQFVTKDNTEWINEFLSRNYKYKALWKTYFEFNNAIFNNVNSDNRILIYNKLEKEISKKYGKENIVLIKAQPKLKTINKNDFFIEIDDNLIDASEATSSNNENLDYFILYVSDQLKEKKQEIIKDILKLQS